MSRSALEQSSLLWESYVCDQIATLTISRPLSVSITYGRGGIRHFSSTHWVQQLLNLLQKFTQSTPREFKGTNFLNTSMRSYS